MNEVEKLFQEQQAVSAGTRSLAADVQSVQPMMNQDETMNAAESMFRADQAVPSGAQYAEKQAKTVQLLLNIAIILKVIQTTLENCAYRFPKVVLALMQWSSANDESVADGLLTLPMLGMSMLYFGIVLLFYFLLSKQNRKTTAACVPLLVLTVLLPLITAVVGVLQNFFFSRWSAAVLDSESFVAYNIIRSAVSVLSLSAAPVVPMFAAAAGMILSRRKYTQE